MSISSIRQRIHELKVQWIHAFDKLLTYLSTTILLLCGGVKHYPEKHIIDMRLLSPLGEVCHRQSQDTVTVTLKWQKNTTSQIHTYACTVKQWTYDMKLETSVHPKRIKRSTKRSYKIKGHRSIYDAKLLRGVLHSCVFFGLVFDSEIRGLWKTQERPRRLLRIIIRVNTWRISMNSLLICTQQTCGKRAWLLV